MNPEEYYNNQFREDFNSFWSKVPNRKNYVTGDPIFKFAGLVKGDYDSLSEIKNENLLYFLSALGYTILIDQLMYTYFQYDYPRFQKMTLYPKMYVGWMNANPWMVFHQNVRLPRNQYGNIIVEEVFEEFTKFIVKDLKMFFKKHKFREANWESIKKAIINDPDIKKEAYGLILIKEINN
jgi:hypothetical protein